jgi:hypothetical protein
MQTTDSQTPSYNATLAPDGLAPRICSPLLGRVLDKGEMQWEMWAEIWRTSLAYGNGQPEIHPTHAKVIAEFGEARKEIDEMTDALRSINDALDECLMVPANVLPAWNKVLAILWRWQDAANRLRSATGP